MVDHKDAIKSLESIRSNEKDVRDRVCEAIDFNTEPDGHWEETAIKIFENKPRYQFDLIYPAISSITDEIIENEFNSRVVEAGEGKESDMPDKLDAMLRSIQSMSKFSYIVQEAGKNIVSHGFDAWMVTTGWADVDAFEQDLLIKYIPDSVNRVWLGPCSEIDFSDRREGFVESCLSFDEYKKKYPKGSKVSVGKTEPSKKDGDDITIADYYYIKDELITLHLLSDNRVVRADQFDPVAEEEAKQGITIVRSRERKIPRCYMRKMDGGGWLEKEQETVFSFIPVVGTFGNYSFNKGLPNYFGLTQKLMDDQRVYNYSRSREIGRTALASEPKWQATKEQVAGLADEIAQALSDDRVKHLPYNHVEGQMPPGFVGPPAPDLGHAQIAAASEASIEKISSSFAPARGEAITNHSGKAYEMLSLATRQKSISYVRALKCAIGLTAKILIDAIPRVYDTPNRQVRLMNEDGAVKFETFNKPVFDEETKSWKTVNDLSVGHYDVVATTGAAFHSRKEEGLKALLEYAKIRPQVLDYADDVAIKALDAPYIDQIGDRIRERMIEQGLIPESQLTDDEKEKIVEEMQRAAHQQQQPDPIQQATVAAIMQEVQKSQAEIAERQAKLQIDFMEQQRKMMETMIKRAASEASIQKTQSETIQNLDDSKDGVADAEAERLSSQIN